MACSKCGKLLGFFYSRRECVKCGRDFCSDCSDNRPYHWTEELLSYNNLIDYGTRSVWWCKECFEKYRHPLRKKLKALLERPIPDIELVSINYKGYKPYIGEKISIQSFCYKDKSRCDEELKFLAFYLGCDMVIEIESEKETRWGGENGNYAYSVFSKRGYAVKKDLSRNHNKKN